MIREYGKPQWNSIDRPKAKNSKDLFECHSVHHIAYSMCTKLGANTDLRGERPVTNHLIHGTAIMYIKIVAAEYKQYAKAIKSSFNYNMMPGQIYLNT
jgi:hypothetical protein